LPSQIVAEDERTIAFMDIDPATRGHLLVIPREHSANLWEIDPEDLAATARAAQGLATRVRDRLGADGVNLINACGPLAWQTVFHFHIHVILRYKGDPRSCRGFRCPATRRRSPPPPRSFARERGRTGHSRLCRFSVHLSDDLCLSWAYAISTEKMIFGCLNETGLSRANWLHTAMI
jgi:histidine triad (HIT) family protein